MAHRTSNSSLIETAASNLDFEIRRRLKAEVERLELDLCEAADGIVAVSGTDLENLSRHGKPSAVVPNGVRAVSILGGLEYWQSRYRLYNFALFVGSAHPPNAEGLAAMIGDDLSYLAPNERIVIIGGVCHLLDAMSDLQINRGRIFSRVDLLYYQDDGGLASVMSLAKVILLPIVSGGGTNLKTAEALYSRKPIIATSRAFRGYETFMSFPNVSIADNPHDFRRLVTAKLGSVTKKYTFSQQQINALERLSWSQCTVNLAHWIREVHPTASRAEGPISRPPVTGILKEPRDRQGLVAMLTSKVSIARDRSDQTSGSTSHRVSEMKNRSVLSRFRRRTFAPSIDVFDSWKQQAVAHMDSLIRLVSNMSSNQESRINGIGAVLSQISGQISSINELYIQQETINLELQSANTALREYLNSSLRDRTAQLALLERRGAAGATSKREGSMTRVSYAGNFEDVRLWRLFDGLTDGFYIDIGASHGFLDNTSYGFYAAGWTGVNVEPGPLFETVQHVRTRDINLNCAVSHTDGEVTFFYHPESPATSTLFSSDMAKLNIRERVECVVPSIKLSTLVERYVGDRHVHFLAVDVEGAEEIVLRSGNWRTFRPEIIVAEATAPFTNDPVHASWSAWMKTQGYIVAYFDGINLWLVREESQHFVPAIARPINQLDFFERYDQEKEMLRAKVEQLEKENKILWDGRAD